MFEAYDSLQDLPGRERHMSRCLQWKPNAQSRHEWKKFSWILVELWGKTFGSDQQHSDHPGTACRNGLYSQIRTCWCCESEKLFISAYGEVCVMFGIVLEIRADEFSTCPTDSWSGGKDFFLSKKKQWRVS